MLAFFGRTKTFYHDRLSRVVIGPADPGRGSGYSRRRWKMSFSPVRWRAGRGAHLPGVIHFVDATTLRAYEGVMDTVPLGPIVPEATRPLPGFERHIGDAVTLEPLSIRYIDDLWEAGQAADLSWSYLKYGPFPAKEDLATHLNRISGLEQQPFFALLPTSTGKAEGWASFCDIAPGDAAIEIGSIWFSPRLQRTRAATEAIFLMMQHAFMLGYYRVVWRCNAFNAASMRAARRFGFSYEGTWRGDGIVKGRRRDTAWFSIVEAEWPAQRALFRAWLDRSNFDANGVALNPLSPSV